MGYVFDVLIDSIIIMEYVIRLMINVRNMINLMELVLNVTQAIRYLGLVVFLLKFN